MNGVQRLSIRVGEWVGDKIDIDVLLTPHHQGKDDGEGLQRVPADQGQQRVVQESGLWWEMARHCCSHDGRACCWHSGLRSRYHLIKECRQHADHKQKESA